MKQLGFFVLVFLLFSCKGNESSKSSNSSSDSAAINNSPEEIIRVFIKNLGEKKFDAAYEMTDGKIWGTYNQFIDPKAFGAMYQTTIHDIHPVSDENGKKAVFVDATYFDKEGSNRFKEIFYLDNFSGNWKIVKLKVTEVNGKAFINADDFALVANDNSITNEEIRRLLSKHWSRFSEDFISSENPSQKPKIDLICKQFYKVMGEDKLFVIFGLTNPNDYHAARGRCDAALFSRESGSWKEIDFVEGVGGFGPYGSYAGFEKVSRFGKLSICASLGSGDMHSGYESNYIDLIGVNNNRIYNIGSFNSGSSNEAASEYGATENSVVDYKFINQSQEFYDLELTTKDLINNTKTKKAYKFFNNKYDIR